MSLMDDATVLQAETVPSFKNVDWRLNRLMEHFVEQKNEPNVRAVKAAMEQNADLMRTILDLS